MDLMATAENAKAPWFFSRRKELLSEGLSASAQPWPHRVLLFVFPPWPLRSGSSVYPGSCRLRDSGGSRLAVSTMVCGSRAVASGLFTSSSLGGGSVGSGTHPDARRGSILAYGLAVEWARLLKKGYSVAVVHTLLSSRKRSASLAYVRVWHVCEAWCEEQEVQPLRASIGYLLEFLQGGLQKGLSLSCLLVQLPLGSVGGACLFFGGPLQGKSVALHPDVSHLFQGVKRLRPPIRPVVPSWDLNLVLSALVQAPFEPRLRLRILRLRWSFWWLSLRCCVFTSCRLCRKPCRPVYFLAFLPGG
ncbi:uncharacterized protein LOC115465299 [Microcaecilia unicolor]|uniref:Uncharacterized protein LOC115465299 n=1 Tax=Microcaecilia unicolor TaxID=1415580 RepID=A0A6P7X7L6_9AMPH|nr:uncharacterized protein LOC115465299 [Microcaecilia unicolor]